MRLAIPTADVPSGRLGDILPGLLVSCCCGVLSLLQDGIDTGRVRRNVCSSGAKSRSFIFGYVDKMASAHAASPDVSTFSNWWSVFKPALSLKRCQLRDGAVDQSEIDRSVVLSNYCCRDAVGLRRISQSADDESGDEFY